MIRNLKILIVVIACALIPGSAHALTIDEKGVAGTIEAGTQNPDVGNVTAWGNYLLSLGENASVTFDAPGDDSSATENYETNAVYSYGGTLTGGQRIDGAVTNVSGFTWVLAKYNGQNAGYVLFYVPDFGTTIPEYSYSIWGNQEQYRLTHITGYGPLTTVPDGGATITLLGLGMLGLGYVRRRLA